jgi:hypothetical protein
MKLIATASGTGFGPTSALAYFLEWAADRDDIEIEIDVPTPVANVLRPLVRPEWHLTTRSNESGTTSIPSGEGAVVVNFGRTELLSAEPLWDHHLFIDCVGWLNSAALTPMTRSSSRITALVEYFPPLRSPTVSAGFQLIRPCIRRSVRGGGLFHHVLLSLGGGIFPDIRMTEHPLFSVAQKMQVLARRGIPFTPIVCSGGGTATDGLCTFPLATHRKLIQTARIVIAVPGLYTVFETLEARRPLLLLPPTNYTQSVQYTWYRNQGLVTNALDWLSLLDLPPVVPEILTPADEREFTSNLRLKLGACDPDFIAKELRDAVARIDAGCPPYAPALGESIIHHYLQPPLPPLESLLHDILS